jgi:type IV pilus assembly protein PilM
MFRRQTRIGLDLGQHSLKCALIEADRGNVRTLWRGEILPDRKSHDQDLGPDDLCARVEALLNSCRGEGLAFDKTVSASIQGEGTVFRYIELPPLSKKELENAVPSVARKFIPFPMSEVSLSFINVPQMSGKEKKSGVFFVAAPRKNVEELQSLLKRCAVSLNKIEPAELAMVRTFSRNHNVPKEQISGLVHVGFHLTHVIVVHDGCPYFARNFSTAGRKFTYAFQMAHQSAWEDADRYKLEYDATGREVPIEPFLTRWLDDVKKSFGFFTSQFPADRPVVKKAYLSGGSALMQGLHQRLAEYLNMPVEVSGFERLRFDAEKSSPGNLPIFNVAIGLALEE